MSVKRFALTAFLATNLVVPVGMAQNNELSGLVGRTFISDQGVTSGALSGSTLHFGNGTTIEVNYARRLASGVLSAIALEVPFVLNPDEDWSLSRTPFGDYRSFFVTPAARLNVFANTGVSPWVSFGGGFGHFSESSLKTANTTGVLQAGVGLDVKLVERLSLRGGFRDFWSGVPQLEVNTGKSRQHNYFVGAGIVWRF